MKPLISVKEAASLPKEKVPLSRISRVALRKAPGAERDSAEPTLILRTPVAARFSTVPIRPSGWFGDGGQIVAEAIGVPRGWE